MESWITISNLHENSNAQVSISFQVKMFYKDLTCDKFRKKTLISKKRKK